MRYLTPINTEDDLPHQPPLIAYASEDDPEYPRSQWREATDREMNIYHIWWNTFYDETDKGVSEETADHLANCAVQELHAIRDKEQDTPVEQHADALVFMITANGGLEDPFFQSFFNYDQAQARFEEWAKDLCSEVGDRVDFLKVTKDGNTVSIKEAQFEEHYTTDEPSGVKFYEG